MSRSAEYTASVKKEAAAVPRLNAMEKMGQPESLSERISDLRGCFEFVKVISQKNEAYEEQETLSRKWVDGMPEQFQ